MNEILLPKHGVKIMNRETLTIKAGKTITLLVLTLGAMIIVLSTVFISMTSANSQKGYELTQLQLQNNDLENQQEKLKTDLTQSMSFQEIQSKKKIQDMTAPDQKNYITKKKPN